MPHGATFLAAACLPCSPSPCLRLPPSSPSSLPHPLPPSLFIYFSTASDLFYRGNWDQNKLDLMRMRIHTPVTTNTANKCNLATIKNFTRASFIISVVCVNTSSMLLTSHVTKASRVVKPLNCHYLSPWASPNRDRPATIRHRCTGM